MTRMENASAFVVALGRRALKATEEQRIRTAAMLRLVRADPSCAADYLPDTIAGCVVRALRSVNTNRSPYRTSFMLKIILVPLV